MSQMNLHTTAHDLRRALEAVVLPLNGTSKRAHHLGRVWVERLDSGTYRFTAAWNGQWARSYAPSTATAPHSSSAPRPCAITADDVECILGGLRGHQVEPEATVCLRTTDTLLCMEPLGPGASWRRNAPIRSGQDEPAPAGDFPLPAPAEILPLTPALYGGALAALLGVNAAEWTDHRLSLYAVPNKPHKAAWTLGGWAHGRVHLPAYQRKHTADLASLAALAG